MVDKDNLYTYLDNQNSLAIHLFQGKSFVESLLATHGVSKNSERLICELILSLQSLVVFLKNEESLGVYIDSETPKLSFKLECNAKGKTRILVLPENFNESEIKLTGKCRITKFSPPDNIPYSSIINFEDKQSNEILNSIFSQSYQMDSHFIFKNDYDFMLIHKLPGSDENLDLISFVNDNELDLDNAEKFNFLSSKKVIFECNCNKELFISRINTLSNKDELLSDCPLEIKCDYCKSEYIIESKDLGA